MKARSEADSQRHARLLKRRFTESISLQPEPEKETNSMAGRSWEDIQADLERDQAGATSADDECPNDPDDGANDIIMDENDETTGSRLHHDIGCQTDHARFPTLASAKSVFERVLSDKGTQTSYKFRLTASSLKSEEDYKTICGVTGVFFQQISLILRDKLSGSRTCTRDDKIMIFLVKLRHNLAFVFMAKIFDMHRTTISNFFEQVLDELFKDCLLYTSPSPRD